MKPLPWKISSCAPEYGDPVYPLRAHLQRPFEGNHLPQEQKDFNKSMKTLRVSV